MSRQTRWKQVCPYCHEKTASGHLVPPSCGDPSILVCDAINRYEQENGMEKKADWSIPKNADIEVVDAVCLHCRHPVARHAPYGCNVETSHFSVCGCRAVHVPPVDADGAK